MGEAPIIHVNIVDYPAAVAQAHDPSLAGRPFVIAADRGPRRIVLSPSQVARTEGITCGMSLRAAEDRLPSLTVLSADDRLISRADSELTRIIDSYSPTIQGERGGHLYLDMSGTGRLFGSVVDSALRLRREIRDRIGLDAAVAVGANKLVAKIGTRTVRPYGLAEIRSGDEAAFLAGQGIDLMSGVGPVIGGLLKAVGITQIGELARLSDEEVIAFLGVRGLRLRDRARGLDNEPVGPSAVTGRRIRRSVDFNEPTIEEEAIKAAVVSAASDASLSMRCDGLGCSTITIALRYSDGKESQASQANSSGQWITDAQVEQAAWQAAQRAAGRRVHLVGFSLTLARLESALYPTDLFIPPIEEKHQSVQRSVDRVRGRYGASSILHASALCHGH